MSIRSFFSSLFQTPQARHAEAVAVFRARGFTEWQAERAATELWLACRAGRRTPDWILERLKACD